MPRSKSNNKETQIDPQKAARITFRVDENLAAKFKAMAALRGMKLEEYGRLTLKNLIKKEKRKFKNWQDNM